MRLIEKSIASSVYDALNESTNYLKKYTNKIDKMSDKALYKAWLEVSKAPTEEKKYDRFGACVEVTDTMASDALWEIEGELCRRGYMDEDSNKTDKWKEFEENINESEDAARDLGIEPGSDEEEQLNSLYNEKKVDWTDLAGSDQTAVEHFFSRFGNDFTGKSWNEVESNIRSACNDIGWANEELIDNGYWMDGDMDPEPNEKMVMDYIFQNHFLPKEKPENINEAEEVKEEKKVTKVEVTILPEVKFLWAEGNQDHVKALFGSAEEHDMDFSKFQNAVYVLDQEVAERDGGYDKVKYIANIQVKFTYEDGSTSEETTTYAGRVDCGDGYKYVTVSKNMKHFIQEEFKDAEVIVKEDDTAELKESASFDEMVIDSYNHLTNDLGKNPTVDDIVDDILKNYDQEYINDDTPENSLKASKDVKYVLRNNNLDFEDLNESATYEVDMTIEDNLEDEINNLLKSNNADGVQYKVVNSQGVGGGWPTVRFSGEDNKVREFLKNIGFEDLDAYKKENINESEKPDETLDEVIKKDAEMAWEVGKPYREFRSFEKTYKDMGYVVTENDYRKYEEYYDDCKAAEQDSLKESEETNMTLKEYAMKLHEGYIDMDVCDTEIDMVVAFVCDFNETPADNYDKFLHLLGERTKVVKASEWSLVCDFTSVFKPYEEKLKEFFDMEYSEFDEAYYEAVINLEYLIPGMSGEKTYGELIDILNS